MPASGGALLAQRRFVGLALVASAVSFVALAVVTSSATASEERQEAEAVLTRFRELLTATESKRVVAPLPNSRSRIVIADGSSDFFLYIERGNLRGQETVDVFYQQLNAGDVDAAYETFVQNNQVLSRISDRGWNGLGVPMVTEAGTEIPDVYFKVVEGMFKKVDDITAEDASDYLDLIRDILIPALEGGAGS